MGSYGRNFGFRIIPESENRPGRYAVAKTGNKIPIGAPIAVTAGATPDTGGRQIVGLAAEGSVKRKGETGILVYEYGPAAFAGDDPFLTTYADKDVAPLGAAVQLVSGPNVKVVLRNTVANTFLESRDYTARKMVAGLTADQGTTASTLVVGDYLVPGVGTDSGGYWKLGGGGATPNGWLVITKIDDARGELEAHLTF